MNAGPHQPGPERDGQTLAITTRLIVAPAAGTFRPAPRIEWSMRQHPSQAGASRIDAGQLIGYVVNASERIAVTSPFDGEVNSLIAWPNERLRKYQQILSLEIAA